MPWCLQSVVQSLQSVGSPGTRDTPGCESPNGFWEQNPNPLQEYQVPSTVEPCLQSLKHFMSNKWFVFIIHTKMKGVLICVKEMGNTEWSWIFYICKFSILLLLFPLFLLTFLNELFSKYNIILTLISFYWSNHMTLVLFFFMMFQVFVIS